MSVWLIYIDQRRRDTSGGTSKCIDDARLDEVGIVWSLDKFRSSLVGKCTTSKMVVEKNRQIERERPRPFLINNQSCWMQIYWQRRNDGIKIVWSPHRSMEPKSEKPTNYIHIANTNVLKPIIQLRQPFGGGVVLLLCVSQARIYCLYFYRVRLRCGLFIQSRYRPRTPTHIHYPTLY